MAPIVDSVDFVHYALDTQTLSHNMSQSPPKAYLAHHYMSMSIFTFAFERS